MSRRDNSSEQGIVDLDAEPDLVILVTFRGQRRAVDAVLLRRMLEMHEREQLGRPMNRGRHPERRGRSLASLGKLVTQIAEAGRAAGALDCLDADRLLSALRDFDRNLIGRRSSQAGHLLREIASWRIPADVRAAIEGFLDEFTYLEQIPRRTPRGL